MLHEPGEALLAPAQRLLGPPPLDDDGGLVGPDAEQQPVPLGREVGVAGAGDEDAVVVADAEAGDGDVQHPGPEGGGDGGGRIGPVGPQQRGERRPHRLDVAASGPCLQRTTSTTPSPVRPASRT